MTYRDLVAALSSGRRAIHRLLYPGLDLGRGDHLPLRWWARALWQAVSAPTSPGRARDRQGVPAADIRTTTSAASVEGRSERALERRLGRAGLARGAEALRRDDARTREHYGSRRSS